MIANLNFVRVGCCGEYLNATVELKDGSAAIVTDHEDGSYSVTITKNGFLVGIPHRLIDADAAEKLIF